jgi:hypothetical protein
VESGGHKKLVAENFLELLIVVLAKLRWNGEKLQLLASIFVSMLSLNPRLNVIELALRSSETSVSVAPEWELFHGMSGI